MTVESGIVHKQFRLFEAVAGLHRAGLMGLDEGALASPVVALSQFLFGYAFERQGRSPTYPPLARAVVERVSATPGFWSDPHSACAIWDLFCLELDNLTQGGEPKSPNAMLNPLCPEGTHYRTKGHSHATKGLSAVQFVQQKLEASGYNLAMWAVAMLQQDRAEDAYHSLSMINGIKDKIASFFLRDVAWCFSVRPDQNCELLQPVDVWARRTVFELDRSAKGREAKWIVEQALEAGVLPEAVNAGMWYFGALIAGSEFQLYQALNNPQVAWCLVDEHVARLRRQADAWGQDGRLPATL